MAAKKNSSPVFDVQILAMQLMDLSGELISQDDNLVVIKHKKPRSSKTQRTAIQTSRIIMTSTDEDGTTVYYNELAEVDVLTGTLEYNEDGDQVTITDEDGGTTVVNVANIGEITAEDESEAPAKGAKKAPAKKAAPAKKGKKDEDEDWE